MRGWWWLWSGCPGLGVVRMGALQAVAQEASLGLDDLLWWSSSRLQQALGWSDAVMGTVDRYRASQGESPDLEVPAGVVLPMDAEWPISLDRLERRPLALHCHGDQTLLPSLGQRRAVAVVGTRSASSHGVQMAEQLGRSLAEAGWPVLSGLAGGGRCGGAPRLLVRRRVPCGRSWDTTEPHLSPSPSGTSEGGGIQGAAAE